MLFLKRSWWRGKNRKRNIILTLLIAATAVYAVLNLPFYLDNSLDEQFIKTLIQNPNSISDSEALASVKRMAISNSTDPDLILALLSDIVQNQLTDIQSSKNCLSGGFTLHCGHDDTCGLGCQLHHRIACLAMSYAMGIPLIHELDRGWAFSAPWEEAFLTLGSIHCPINDKTIHVKWRSYRFPFLYLGGNWCRMFPVWCPKENQFEFPLSSGVPVSKELVTLIEEHTKDPFLWMMGQFTKFTMKLSNTQRNIVDSAKESMGILDSSNSFLVGFHVRRTDKKKESLESFHDIDVYMSVADKYFRSLLPLTPEDEPMTRTVFIASDDHKVLPEAQKRFPPPTWNVVGMTSEETLRNEKQRRSHLHEIVRDIVLLSECDHIVCGYSSNVCRLLLEILSYKDPVSISGPGKSTRLTSLDDVYEYVTFGHRIPPKLFPIS